MTARDIVAAILLLLRKTLDCFCWKEHGACCYPQKIGDRFSKITPLCQSRISFLRHSALTSASMRN